VTSRRRVLSGEPDQPLSPLEARAAALMAELLVAAYRRRHPSEEEGAHPLPQDGAAWSGRGGAAT
jgi:hypothetical protein